MRITPGASFQIKACLTSVSARLLEPARLLQLGFEGGEGHDERQWRIQQRDRAIAGIPFGGSVVLRVDDEDHAADFSRGAQAAPAGRADELTAEALSLHAYMRGDAREPETRHIVPGEAAA